MSNILDGFDADQVRMMAEQCILLDEEDNAIGANSKVFCHQWENIEAGKALHRAFSVFLFNSEGKLLLQQRSADKITFPLRWTNTCCSHPLSRPEELEEKDQLGVRNAAIRKLEHEMGIPLDTFKPSDFVYVSRIIYRAQSDDVKWGEHEIDYIMFLQKDVVCDNLNKGEVADAKYVTAEELKELIATRADNGIVISPWFHMIMDQFGYNWWSDLTNIMANKGLADPAVRDKIHPVSIEKDIVS